VEVALPGLDGVHDLAAVHRHCPATRVLALVPSHKPFDLVTAIESDVGGVLRTSVTPVDFVHAIRRVSRGDPVVDHDLAIAALRRNDCPLTPRELAVLEHVAEGHPLAEI